ncbi:MAG: 50S ribosomal protein L25 [Planctomycetales bacterium]|nr:50S ribosomal protein L25 [Planctomycetales bacterium]
MIESLTVARREKTGKRNMRRLRAAGHVPAVLYGHGEQCVHLAVPTDQLRAAIRHGSKLVDLTGDLSESALIREVQWDTYGIEVLHIDLTRVNKSELVEVTVPIHLRGEAPGTHEGGVVQHLLHEVDLECTAVSIPDHLTVSINHLEVDQAIHASELALPEGAKLLTDGELVVVQCVVPRAVEESETPSVEGAEPELIGRKEAAEEEEG